MFFSYLLKAMTHLKKQVNNWTYSSKYDTSTKLVLVNSECLFEIVFQRVNLAFRP